MIEKEEDYWNEKRKQANPYLADVPEVNLQEMFLLENKPVVMKEEKRTIDRNKIMEK